MKPRSPRFVLVLVLLLCFSGCASLKDYQTQATDRSTPLLITEYGQHGKASSIGGVSYGISYYNLSGKTIKYLNVYATPYSLVGDVAPSTINNKAQAELMQVGPIETETKTSFVWENVWFNRTITCTEIDTIKIHFSDGTSKVLNREEIQKALYQPKENNRVLESCK